MSNNSTTTTKSTHFDLESEKALLGAILTLGDHFGTVMSKLNQVIDIETFATKKHQTIFAAMSFFYLAKKGISCEGVAFFSEKSGVKISEQEILNLIPYSAKITDINEPIGKILKKQTERKIRTIAENLTKTTENLEYMEDQFREIEKELASYRFKIKQIKKFKS